MVVKRGKKNAMHDRYMAEDMVIEIMSRLPVKSLMRFKCVSKSFLELPTDPSFIALHLKNYTEINEEADCLLVSYYDKVTYKSVVSQTDSKPSVAVEMPGIDENMGVFKDGAPELLGPVNGIVCLHGWYDNIALWNPAIRDLKILPLSNIPRTDPNAKCFRGGGGFGFDSKTNDYKVLQILTYGPHLNRSYQVEIYNLSTNSWRKLDSPPPTAEFCWAGVPKSTTYKNRYICWCAKDSGGDSGGNGGDVILSLDLCTEKFQTTSLPPKLPGVTREILLYNDLLGVVIYPLFYTDRRYDIWVMNEFGVSKSWSKVFTIGPLVDIEMPIFYWKNDEFLLQNSNGTLVLYNPFTKQVKELTFHAEAHLWSMRGLVYKESLVPILARNWMIQDLETS